MSGLIFCMVMMEMWVVAKTSALTLSVAGTLKEVSQSVTTTLLAGSSWTTHTLLFFFRVR